MTADLINRETTNANCEMQQKEGEANRLHQEKVSDLALGERVRRSFGCLGYAQLSAIECETVGNSVILFGKLESYYLKQIAQTVAMKVPGVHHVTNDIIVNPEQ